MSKQTALYWLGEAENVPVHYFHTDEEITIKEICEGYNGDTQVQRKVEVKDEGD